MKTISGYVGHIIYRNPENGYSVLVLVSEQEETTCVGYFPDLSEGENLAVTGEETEHPAYGTQFKVHQYEEVIPQGSIAMERYLGSGFIRGVGLALAARIVRHFKDDTFRIIEEEPERLAEIKGISERKAMEIADQVNAKKDFRQAMIFLQQYGISTNLANKIYKNYGEGIYRILKENPYQLADEMEGIGFRIADEIAMKAGIRVDSDYRIKSGIQYVLQQATMEGHTFLPMEEATGRTAALLSVPEEEVATQYMNLAMDKKIVMKEARDGSPAYQDGTTRDGVPAYPGGPQVYSQMYYYMEMHSAEMLKSLNRTYPLSEKELAAQIKRIESQTKIILDEQQVLAVKGTAKHGVCLITGGPGTGKTTTINTIIRYFEMEGLDFLLAAPTGRAAKRMSETTGFEAKTIHRLLELNGDAKENAFFDRNEANPLDTDAIIIDEMSMVDITLMYALLKAVADKTRLVLVGDANQLPSVGPGSVLKDMIHSARFHTVMLTKIFRQAETSDIIVNAHKIHRGEEVATDNKSRDFFFLKRQDADVVIQVTLQLMLKKLPGYVQASPLEIQVLTPMRKGVLGVENLNRILQGYLNPSDPRKRETEYPNGVFREGDKVMQTKNNYELGVFNGDMGTIRSLNTYSETMTVVFDENRQVEYSIKALDELELAYAITIHKSQGSEYPAVILPLLAGPRPLMNRNLLYTAVTRAKKCVTIVGSEEVFREMIANASQLKRYSGLCDRIQEGME